VPSWPSNPGSPSVLAGLANPLCGHSPATSVLPHVSEASASDGGGDGGGDGHELADEVGEADAAGGGEAAAAESGMSLMLRPPQEAGSRQPVEAPSSSPQRSQVHILRSQSSCVFMHKQHDAC